MKTTEQRFRDINMTGSEAFSVLCGVVDGFSSIDPSIVESIIDIVLTRRIEIAEEGK